MGFAEVQGAGRRAGRAAAPAGQHGPLPHAAVAARPRPPRRVPERLARAPGCADRPAGDGPCPGPAGLVRGRPGRRRGAADRRRRPPRPAAVRRSLGAPVRLRADPRVLGEGDPVPAQPRRGPTGQPRPVAGRDHPDGLAPAARAYVARRAKDGLSKSEIIRCLKRYVAREGLPAPAPWTRLTCKLPGRLGPLSGCRTQVLALDRSAGRPPNPDHRPCRA
jgi:hypothetical protein